MNKSSTSYLLKCYIWLVYTIAHGPISRKDIDSKWAKASVNDYKTDCISESTFHRWRSAAQELFDIEIKCNTYGEYYISNASNVVNSNLKTRILQLFTINQLRYESKDLQSQILFEQPPAGEQYLSTIIDALRNKHVLCLTHQSFHKPKPSTFPVHPYCLKMFHQRWYLLAFSPNMGDIRIYALDRIAAVKKTTDSYTIPKNFDAETYFINTYGVSGMENKIEEVEIKIESYQANFLRTLPLHSSQQEIERNEVFSIFRFYIVPSYEFILELRKYGSALEVLKPANLREKIRTDLEYQLSKYKDE